MTNGNDDAITRFRALREAEGPPWLLWKAPGDDLVLAAGARIDNAPVDGADWREWLHSLRVESDSLPVFYFLAFDPSTPAREPWNDMPRAWAFVPRTVLRLPWVAHEEADGAVRQTPIPLVADGVAETSYEESVRMGLRALWKGELEKVVLARKASFHISSDLDSLLSRMLDAAAGFCIAFSLDGERIFVSLTPERLARVEDGTVRTAALAGTALRSDDPAEDAAAGRDLESSVKEREEHDYVVRMITEELSTLCEDVWSGPRQILALPHVYHLNTPIDATLRPGRTIADVVSALHPTPAVAGLPRDAAMRCIAGIEDFDRGLFAGVAGWMDAAGNGDAAVTIRSALLHDGVATVFAGAGIVRDSDPEAEQRETSAKMRMVLEILA